MTIEQNKERADEARAKAQAKGEKIAKANGQVDTPLTESELTEPWFQTPEQVRSEVSSDSDDALWDGYLYLGCVTLFAGKQKAGKSTFLFNLMDALGSDSSEFLGHEIPNPTITLCVTEEGPRTLKHKISEYGLYATRSKIGTSMSELLQRAAQGVKVHKAQFIIIDTLSFWLNLPAKAEDDSAQMSKALAPILKFAAECNVAVLLVHHQRKGGGQEGEGVRGSTAITGAVDVILEYERPQVPMKRGSKEVGMELDRDHPTRRVIRALSRFPDTPDELIFDYDLNHKAYGLVSEMLGGEVVDSEATNQTSREEVLAYFDTHNEATIYGIHKDLGINQQTVKRALTKLIEKEYVTQLQGTNNKGQKATRYTRSSLGDVMREEQ